MTCHSAPIEPMKKHLVLALFAGVVSVFGVVTEPSSVVQERAAAVVNRLLPVPQSVKMGNGVFVLTAKTTINIAPECDVVGQHFADRLRRGTGWNVPVTEGGKICLKINAAAGTSPEAYTLRINNSGIVVQGATPAGVARGLETLFQLMPTAVYGSNRCERITLPAVEIADAPRFAWRGFMLDVSRYFVSRDDVLKFLDGMAADKLNIFQWHLTDDQGWRLPIKGYPKLTQDTKHSYSREDIRAVVEHAAKLGITIVPEIDVPGHSSATCNAYPEIATLNKNGKPGNTMNPGAPATYAFLEKVIDDVAVQFPDSPYIHIGTDEVGVGRWSADPQCQALMKQEKIGGPHQLYTFFVNRMASIVKQHGRKPVAWEDSYSKEADPNLIFMGWRDMRACISMPKAGRDIIMAPGNVAYFDIPNSRSLDNAQGGNSLNLNVVYLFEPNSTALTPEERCHVLGAQGCLWGDHIIPSLEYFFRSAFPRTAALGETLWSPREKRDWDSFLVRLALQRERYDAMKIPYFWETDSLAVSLGSWTTTDLSQRDGILDFPLTGKIRQAGFAEFSALYGTGEGQFRVTGMELLRDGKVIDRCSHNHDATVSNDFDHFYHLTIPEITGNYTLRVHAQQLRGDCSAIVQMIPALTPDRYSPRSRPECPVNGVKPK